MQTGWIQDGGGKWYYYDPSSGENQTGWIKDNSGNWYYLNSDGTLKTGWQNIDGTWYYFYSDGKMQTGWIQDSEGDWYYYNESSGKSETGWIEDNNGKWYYLNADRTLQTGWMQDGDKKYYLNSDGEMQTGWVEDNGNWYYFNSKGEMQTGWVRDKGKKYYLNSDGEMQTGTVNVDGKDYEFNDSGELQNDDEPGETATSDANGLYSDKLIEFIEGWEGYAPKAYPDPYYPNSQACWTIGHGTTYQSNPSAFPNGLSSTCTPEQADQWVREEATVVAKQIKSALDGQGASVSQQAFDCLCDIAYNAGAPAVIHGHTWNAIISGDANDIEYWVMKWSGANGQTSNGLVLRCRARVNMCLYGTYDSTH